MRIARLIKNIAVTFVLAISFTNTVYADATREYQVKAAYLLNFGRFIYWPKEAFSSAEDKFEICVYGDSPFGENLNLLLNKKVNDRSIKISHVENLSNAKTCRILFISKSSEISFYNFLSNMPRYTLTVSDVKGFSSEGGMIEFVRVKNKIKFEINITQSTRYGIKYRSQLLEVAEKLR